MTFDELQDEVYEDLNGRITAVRLTHAGLEIDFTCDDWRRDGVVSVTLACAGPVRWSVTPGSTGGLRLRDDHPLLWEFNEPHAELYFSSRPANPFELSGRLRERCEQLFGRTTTPTRYLHATAEILAVGYGQIASGPWPLVDALHQVAAPFVECSLLRPVQHTGGYRLLDTDAGHVICRSVTLRGERGAGSRETGNETTPGETR